MHATKMSQVPKICWITWLVLCRYLFRGALAQAAQANTSKTACPTACRCYQQSGVYSIFCGGAGLGEIPNSFDLYAQIFNFSGNHLASVENNAFRNAYFGSVEIVDLSDNRIGRLASNAFASLKNLLEIDLSDNEIDAVRGKLFRNNRFLNTIRLRGNPIEKLGERAFPFSVYVKTLDFEGCKLRHIHRYAFHSTPLLQNLNLKNNALKSPPTMVLRLPQLRTLQLDGNPWRCDAHLWRVLKWLQRRWRRAIDENNSVGGGGSDNALVESGSGSGLQSQPQSLLCVFGETENAVFWDTMEADNFEKFRALQLQQQQRQPQPRPQRRNKRAINAERAGKTNAIRHQKTVNADRANDAGDWNWMTVDNFEQWNFTIPIPVHCAQHHEYSPTRFLKNRYKPKAIPVTAPAAANVVATATMAAARVAPAPPASQPHFIRNSNAQISRNYVERPRPSRNVASGSASASASASGIFPSKFHKNPDANSNTNTNTNVYVPDLSKLGDLERQYLSQMAAVAAEMERQRVTRVDEITSTTQAPSHGAYDKGGADTDTDTDDGYGESFIERNHAIILGCEAVLIAVLLTILYRLWKENHKRVDCTLVQFTAARCPVNNGNGDADGGIPCKGYDTQTSGYKRYSLSDEEYSNIRNGVGAGAGGADEAKYDAESGYLSYHRYNSIEGENPSNAAATNDASAGSAAAGAGVDGAVTAAASFYRRYQRHEISDDSAEEGNDSGCGSRSRAGSRHGPKQKHELQSYSSTSTANTRRVRYGHSNRHPSFSGIGSRGHNDDEE